MLVAFNNSSVIHLLRVILSTDSFGVYMLPLFISYNAFWTIFPSFFFFIIQWCFSLHCIEGNKKSLSDAMEKGVNLREQIFQLYKENYHGGLMKLVVIGGGDVFFLLFFMLVACMCSQKSLGVKEMGFCPPLLFQKMRLCWLAYDLTHSHHMPWIGNWLYYTLLIKLCRKPFFFGRLNYVQLMVTFGDS